MSDNGQFPQPASNDNHLPVFGDVSDKAVPHDAPYADEAVTNTEEVLGNKPTTNQDDGAEEEE